MHLDRSPHFGSVSTKSSHTLCQDGTEALFGGTFNFFKYHLFVSLHFLARSSPFLKVFKRMGKKKVKFQQSVSHSDMVDETAFQVKLLNHGHGKVGGVKDFATTFIEP